MDIFYDSRGGIMDNKIKEIVKEVARLLKDYPELKYYQALEMAKEVYKGEEK